mgnify:CR=1 FL=1
MPVTSANLLGPMLGNLEMPEELLMPVYLFENLTAASFYLKARLLFKVLGLIRCFLWVLSTVEFPTSPLLFPALHSPSVVNALLEFLLFLARLLGPYLASRL